MELIVLYAHFDPEGTVAPRVKFTLQAFFELGARIVFSSTSSIDDSGERYLDAIDAERLVVENIGYDFYAWQQAYLHVQSRLDAASRVLFLNSSVVGPLFDLQSFMAKVERSDADVVGASMSLEHTEHIQSYFHYTKPKALQSDAFRQFWAELEPIGERQKVIDNYELAMTQKYREGGLRVGAIYRAHNQRNPTICHPYRMLARGFPFLKVQLLRDNPKNRVIGPLRWLARRADANFA